jgi:hypothetical protein
MTLSIRSVSSQDNCHITLPGSFQPATAEVKTKIGDILGKYGLKAGDTTTTEEPAKTEEPAETDETPTTKTPFTKDTGDASAIASFLGVDSLEDLIKKLQEMLNKQKTARAELDEKKSSMGIKYADARKTMEEIEEKYHAGVNIKDFLKTDVLKKDENGKYIFNFWGNFNPYTIPEPDRSKYLQALAACIEIENENPELASNAGCHTKYPDKASQPDFRTDITKLYLEKEKGSGQDLITYEEQPLQNYVKA